jgi:hypothetical protein
MEAFRRALNRTVAENRRLHQRVHETWRERDTSKEQRAVWVAAAKEFRDRLDELSFPGGLDNELNLLRMGDIMAAEKALIYLEFHPYYFHSQYIGKRFRRALNKIAPQLPEDLQKRFEVYKLQNASRKLNKYKNLA